jgi:DNA-binding beta-propeller fold protein YncE
MKTIHFLTTFFLFHCLNLLGQVEATEVVSGLDIPVGLAVHGNDLYVAEPEGDEILKVDLTASTPVAMDFITEGLVFPSALIVHENNLYISEYNEVVSGSSRILKVDLTAATPEATEVVGGLTELELMAIYGNDLYVSENASDNIIKIDLTSETPTAIEVVSVHSPASLALYENELYIASNGYENGKIVKIDLTAETPVLADVLTTGSENLRQLVVVGDILYIADADLGKIFKLDLTTLSVADIPNELSNLGISPNPASDFLQVSGIKAMEKYAIYNVLGAKIQEGTLNDEKQIDLKKVPKGIYLLELKNTKTIKFVKE